MSTLTADPKFGRGQVLGITLTYDDSINPPREVQVGDGRNVKGINSVFRDEHPHDGRLLSNSTVECVAVQNKSGGDLVAGQLVELSAESVLSEISGSAAALNWGVVDEYLSAPVRDGEVFWCVVRGPTKSACAGATSGDGIDLAGGALTAPGAGNAGTAITSTDADGNVRFVLTGSPAYGL